MQAFVLDRYGSADRVRAGNMPDPEPREDDVLVRIYAAGVNLVDSKIRNGEFKSFLRHSPGRGSSVPLRIDKGSDGLRRSRTR